MLLLSDAMFDIDLDEIEDFTMVSETGAGGPRLGAVTGGQVGEVRGGWRGGRGRGGGAQGRGRGGLLGERQGGDQLFHGLAGGGRGAGAGQGVARDPLAGQGGRGQPLEESGGEFATGRGRALNTG